VVEEVRCFVTKLFPVFQGYGESRFDPLLTDFLADPGKAVVKQARRIAFLNWGIAPFLQHPPQAPQESAVRSTFSHDGPEEAGPLSRMAGRARGFDDRQEGVSIAVHFEFQDLHRVAARLTFFPEAIP